MRKSFLKIGVAALLFVSATSAAGPSTPAEQTIREVRATLGTVPSFMTKAMPDAAVPSAWSMWKAIELSPNKALPDKYLGLISLAVASQMPCRYCIIADKEFATAGGATQQELNEAVSIAAGTRFWSTWLNGSQLDELQFKKDVDQIVAAKRAPGGSGADIELKDTASAYADIQRTLGIVPAFFKSFPEEALPGAWMQMKSVELSGTTAIPRKYKELIGLAVAAQIPCKSCIYFHTSVAKLNGASDAEIKNALAEAALTRYFSAIVNGYGQDEAAFRREIQESIRAMKRQMAAMASH